MRWIATLLALAVGAWFFSNRRRRAQLQERVQDFTPPAVQDQVRNAAATVTDFTANAREKAGDLPATVTEAANRATEAAKNAASAVQPATDKAREAVQNLASSAQETAQNAAASAQQAVQQTTGGSQSPNGAGSGVETDVDAAPVPTPEAPTATAAPASDGGSRESSPGEPSARPIAGEGTTTADGGTVNALSAVPAGGASTDAAEPLPEGLTPGEPGDRRATRIVGSPSTPGAASPTTGMEQPPEIDRANVVLERTSGELIGNKKTRVFHAATAGNLPGEDNRSTSRARRRP